MKHIAFNEFLRFCNECIPCNLCAVEVLDAVSLEERFKKALPMLTRQIEGLKLLQKTRKMSPDNENRVTNIKIFPFQKCL